MLKVILFILKCVADFVAMLFTIDVGDHTNLGVVMCVVYILLPTLLFIVNFLKNGLMEEIDESYDDSRTRETFSNTYSLPIKFSDGSTITKTHTITKKRRYRK